MKKTVLKQEVRKIKFEENYEAFKKKALAQEEAARILGVSDRRFRRYRAKYEKSSTHDYINALNHLHSMGRMFI